MGQADIRVLVTGDLVLDEPDGAHWLSGLAPTLHAADLVIGHLEVPHTACGQEVAGDVPAPGAPPENLAAIAAAGFDLLSLAGNHMADCGAQGIADTVAELDRLGLGHAGAGANLAAARAPAIAEVSGRRVAVLSYNCVGPEFSWATSDSAGCAYLPMATADGEPLSPRADLQGLLPQALEILAADIAAARAVADTVIVALHKGVVHTPAHLAPYERPAAHAAIELGADAVIGHHAHILRGVEFHQGKPIFHGLGNCCVVTRALSPQQDNAARSEWARQRKAIFGFEPDPAYYLAPFHPQAVNAVLGQLTIDGAGRISAAIVPVFIEAPGRPVLADPAQARAIAAYLARIGVTAGLPPITIDDRFCISEAA